MAQAVYRTGRPRMAGDQKQGSSARIASSLGPTRLVGRPLEVLPSSRPVGWREFRTTGMVLTCDVPWSTSKWQRGSPPQVVKRMAHRSSGMAQPCRFNRVADLRTSSGPLLCNDESCESLAVAQLPWRFTLDTVQRLGSHWCCLLSEARGGDSTVAVHLGQGCDMPVVVGTTGSPGL